ncbi:MAG: IS200/IS605 family accessory protein TnpB-related protein [Gomphosphaeria aponina SAG 52.96 = DSM 107014]|uniref:IS200/IS605 family accessory protein TnpB-related protein n=1 Tax=Gomphosphaeria aponina SAG 52.96 = DSM 107014 TaxID=1521640 RepID=A0A941GQS6_9CHRO|nr:IS200/IS605 family accessory protein TnpB-related protein [Gomphosphaeria aponina SAG 52.96 = DSM 107014]
MGYRKQKILITGNVSDEAHNYLLWLCQEANNLYNSTLFYIRQAHFEQCARMTYFDKNDFYCQRFKLSKIQVCYSQLCKTLKVNNHYQNLGGTPGQQTIKSVVEAIKAYNQLLPMWFKKELQHQAKIPNYRRKNGLYQVTYTGQSIPEYKEFEGWCKLQVAKENQPELVEGDIIIPGGVDLKKEDIAELRIVPANGKLWVEYVIKSEEIKAKNLDYNQALGLDLGINNLITAGKSFIVDGKRLKFINQKFNKFVAKYKQGKSERELWLPTSFYWDETLADVTHKRNCQVRDYINKAARFIVNYCLNKNIGNIVIGWNKGNKPEINLGKRNNQNLVQIPLFRLKNRIKEIAESLGIKVTETEESYTSQSSFLDNDELPVYDEKLKGKHKFSGKRIKRGLYKTVNNFLINADANGAANILKKVATQLGISLVKVGREVLTLPKRYFVYENLYRKYRNRAERSCGRSPALRFLIESPPLV